MRHRPTSWANTIQIACSSDLTKTRQQTPSPYPTRPPSRDDQCSLAQEPTAHGSGRQQQRLSDRIIRTIAGRHRRVARSGVRGRTPLRVVSDRARPHARRECISGGRRVPAACSCRIRLLAQRHWPLAAIDARDGKREAGWTIVCGYREQCTRGRRGASRISLADRRFCQENRGFLSTTLATRSWQSRCS